MNKKEITLDYLNSLIKTKEQEMYNYDKFSSEYSKIIEEIHQTRDIINMIKNYKVRY